MNVPRTDRAEPPELAALTRLESTHPELAPAIALERELLDGERRLQRRLGTPWLDLAADVLTARIASGERLIDFELLGLEWPEVRLRVRQVVDILRRHDVVEGREADRLHTAGRAGDFPDVVRTWFDAVPGATQTGAQSTLHDVVALSVRPFLTRAADVLRQRVSLDGWPRSTCPMCGASPTFAVAGTGDTRQLVCGRCRCRWAFERSRCHHCAASDRIRILAAMDGVYQVTACDGCRRYLKALDVARAGRPFMASVDTVATLALDRAICEQGFIPSDAPG